MTTREKIPAPRADHLGFDLSRLTERQREILCLRCLRELSNSEIGHELRRSEHTIKNHLTVVYAKMGVRGIERACYELGLGQIETITGLRAESV